MTRAAPPAARGRLPSSGLHAPGTVPGPDRASPWHGGHVSPTGNGARHRCRAHPEDFLLTGRLTPWS